MLHALCALAYRRGRPWWDLAPPLQPTCPQCPAAGDLKTLLSGGGVWGWLVEEGCGFGGGGTQWKVNWSIDQAVEERGKVPQVSFSCYCRHLLTLRSLCTMPFMWQWFTLSRICCMQWLWRRERPGQKQKGEEEGEQVNVRKQRNRTGWQKTPNTWNNNTWLTRGTF